MAGTDDHQGVTASLLPGGRKVNKYTCSPSRIFLSEANLLQQSSFEEYMGQVQIVFSVRKSYLNRNQLPITKAIMGEFMPIEWVFRSRGQSNLKKKQVEDMINENHKLMTQLGDIAEAIMASMKEVVIRDSEINQGGVEVSGNELWERQKGVMEINDILKATLEKFGQM
jgi:hypothetical protein